MPWPRFSDDDVTNYLVTEAVALRYLQQRDVEQRHEQASADALAEAKARVAGLK